MTALLAVTTCFLLLIAFRISSRATSTPPISSTITSTSQSTTSNMSLNIFVFPGLHLGLSLLAPMTLTSKEHPEFNLIASELSLRALNIPVATLPHPHIPIFNDFILFPLKKSF